jgi:hypothetical protein
MSLAPFISKAQSNHDANCSLGINLGIKDYSSINEIVNPFIYSAVAPIYSVEFSRKNSNWLCEFSIEYSRLNKQPKNLIVPKIYDLISYETGKLYKLTTDQQYLQTIGSDYYHFNVVFLRKLSGRILFNDVLYGGLGNENYIIESNIASPEIISFSLNPVVLYQVSLKKGFFIKFKNELSLLALNVQMPYSGAFPQIDEEVDNENQVHSLFYNSRFSSINKHLQFSTQLSFEKQMSGRFNLKATYTFRYQKVETHRTFLVAENNLAIGVNYKF